MTLAFPQGARQLSNALRRITGWQRWGAMGVALLIAPLSLSGAIAQSSSDVVVAVLAPVDGVLDASIEVASFRVVEFRPDTAEDQVAAGRIQLRVVDTTGLGSAWSVRVRAESDFTHANDDWTIAASNLRLAQPVARLQKDGPAQPGDLPVAFPAANFGKGRSTLLARCPAGNCQGEFVMDFPAELRVPAGTLAGTYRAALIVEVLTGGE